MAEPTYSVNAEAVTWLCRYCRMAITQEQLDRRDWRRDFGLLAHKSCQDKALGTPEERARKLKSWAPIRSSFSYDSDDGHCGMSDSDWADACNPNEGSQI